VSTTPRLLAEPPSAPAGLPHVLATLEGRQIALALAALAEVAELGEITPMPLAPRWLLGVTNLRGTVTPVIDLAVLLGWESNGHGWRALVLRDGRAGLAVPVTAIHAVHWLDLPTETSDGEQRAPCEHVIAGRPTWVVSAEDVLTRVRRGE
jgi:chemotaxis signal transduction protein